MGPPIVGARRADLFFSFFAIAHPPPPRPHVGRRSGLYCDRAPPPPRPHVGRRSGLYRDRDTDPPRNIYTHINRAHTHFNPFTRSHATPCISHAKKFTPPPRQQSRPAPPPHQQSRPAPPPRQQSRPAPPPSTIATSTPPPPPHEPIGLHLCCGYEGVLEKNSALWGVPGPI